MTPLNKALLRASEIRVRLSQLGAADEMTDEVRAEIDTLRNEYGEVETRIQALTVAGEEAPEERETDRAEVESRASIADIFTATIEHRSTDGATRELQQELGLADNQVPLSMLRGAVEDRAVTPAPTTAAAVGGTRDQDPIIPYVFPDSVGAFLGVAMPTVGVGEHSYPVLLTPASVKTPAVDASADETTGSFSAAVLSPSRLQASFFYRREDRARFTGMAEALRMNLNEAMADALDIQILTGTNGLLTGTNLANNASSAVATWNDYISTLAYGRVDGRYASVVGDLRSVMGTATYAHAGNIYRADETDETALERLMAITGGVRVSAHVTAVASKKQEAVVRRGMRRDMVAPVWEGVTLIPDEITKAATGQIVITAVMLHAVKILRTDGFHKQEFQVEK